MTSDDNNQTVTLPTITFDLPCTQCGYLLRGLEEAGDCPECGEAIAESTAPWRGDRDVKLLLKLRSELQLVGWASLTMLIAMSVAALSGAIGIEPAAMLLLFIACGIPIIWSSFAAQFMVLVHEFNPDKHGPRYTSILVIILFLGFVTLILGGLALALLPAALFISFFCAAFAHMTRRVCEPWRHGSPSGVLFGIEVVGWVSVAASAPVWPLVLAGFAADRGMYGPSPMFYAVFFLPLVTTPLNVLLAHVSMLVLLSWLRKTWPLHAAIIAAAEAEAVRGDRTAEADEGVTR